MAEEIKKFIVSVSPRTREVEAQRDRRRAFWGFIQQNKRYANSSDYTEEQFEAQVEANFGVALKRYLINFFSESLLDVKTYREKQTSFMIEGSFARERTALAGIFFQAHIQGYHSLDFSVEIAGIKKIVELFDGNFSLFTMFLSAYVPRAFDRSIHDYDTENQLTFSFDIPPDITQSFEQDTSTNSSAVTPRQSVNSPMQDERYRWVWLIANGSLVLPVLLSLAFLLLAYKGINEDRRELSNMLKTILEHQESQSKLTNERLVASRKLEDVLIERLIDRLKSNEGDDVTPSRPNNSSNRTRR